MYSFIKNNFVPEHEAFISVKERGFRFGDGLFETIRVTRGVAYQLELHFQRLVHGLKATKISYDVEQLPSLVEQIIAMNQVNEGIVRLSISRGIGSHGYLPAIEGEATLVIETLPLPSPPKSAISLWLSTYEKPSPAALPVHYKLMQGMNSALARMEAEENGCFEALQLNNQKYVCECSSSNILWFKGKTLYTPSLATGALDGTTRHAILRLSQHPVEEKLFTLEELLSAEEVCVTNAAWGILAVKSLKPQNTEWKNHAKSDELKRLLQKDRDDYAAARNA